MKNPIFTFQLFFVFILQMLFSQSGISQAASKISSEPFEESITISTEFFPLDLNLNICLNLNPKFSIGVFGELGVNFSNYFLAAGEHFATNLTILKYNGRDEYDGEKYYGMIGLGPFCRLNLKKNNILDLGLQLEGFLHFDESYPDPGSGVFLGMFTNYQFPSQWNEKTKNGKFKRKPSFGIRASIGSFLESSSIKEVGVMTNFWCRVYLNYNKRYE